jgi:hypothetical protein
MSVRASRVVVHLVWIVLLGGCFGAYQVAPDDVRAMGGLTPNVEDKDAGLVALAPGLDIKTYRVIGVGKFPVTDPAIKDDGDRRKAAEMSTILQNEIVRRLRDTGLHAGGEPERDGVHPRGRQDAAAGRHHLAAG